MALFALTLPLGVWASYDAAAAVERAVLLGAGLALVPLARAAGANVLRYGSSVLAAAALPGAAVAGAWLLRPDLINENVAASAIAALLPLAAGLVLSGIRGRRPFPAVAGAVVAAPSLFALAQTGSRGAWLALGVAAVVVAGVALLRDGARRPLVACLITTTLILLPLGVLGFALLQPDLAGVLGRVGSATGGAAVTRPMLWRDMLSLLQDVPFTGAGLGATMMNDATYVRLSHVGFITHSHHLSLQVALEQGLLGLAAFLGIQATAVYLAIRARAYAVLGALVVVLVHGSVDAGLYVARPAPLLFVPAALAVLAATRVTAGREQPAEASAPTPERRYLAGSAEASTSFVEGEASYVARNPAEASTSVVGGEGALVAGGPAKASASFARGTTLLAVAAVVTVGLLLPGTRAMLQADLGAVLQAKAELSAYEWPETPIQDVLRAPGNAQGVDLGPAIARYEAALALDPANRTAHRRLGQIALARADYAGAEAHLAAGVPVTKGGGPGTGAPLTAGSSSGPHEPTGQGHRAARQLLGELRAIRGDVAGAVALWRGLDLSQGQLDARRFWYDHTGDPAKADAIATAQEQLP